MTVEGGWSSLDRVALQTVGCKLNQAETDSLARKFIEAGYQVIAPECAADVYILNTCTVTHIADRKCRNILRTARRYNSHALIVVTGCYADRATEDILGIDGVGLVVGNRDKERLVDIVSAKLNGHRPREYTARYSPRLRTRALVKIQEGCSQYCTFCVVPVIRGPEHSRPGEDIIAEVNALVIDGYKEVVLTGTRIGKYRHNGGLPTLIEDILAESDVARLRLSSLEPHDLTADLMRLWQDSRLCPHIHLPLQSGSDTVLERMGRSYSTAEYMHAARLAREAIPNLALTTDVMVGFPGETEDEFDRSFRFCERFGFANMHVFPYSARPSTAAAQMPDRIRDTDKKRRSQMMLDLSRRSSQRFREQFLGRTIDVLWEDEKDGIWSGLTDNYIKVLLKSSRALRNELLAAKMVSADDDGLRGELIT